MKNWLTRNLKNIIVTAFVIPILLVAFVSISHVTTFYGLSNPFTWAIYLSVGIEIAALSALAAVSVNMGRFVYVPFFIVTLIQMLGNVFFSFTYIDETGQTFQDWISMVGGLFESMGVEKTDLNTHKTILSFLSGGLLPIISLTFAHMLVKFTEKNQDTDQVPTNNRPSTDQVEELTTEEARELMSEKIKQEEEIKYTPSDEELSKIEEVLKQYEGPVEKFNEDKPINPSDEDLKTLEETLNQYYTNYANKIGEDNDTKNEIVVNETIDEGQEPEPINNIEPQRRTLSYVSPRIYGK
jgi:polyhydroxyalkanoate synthesis regulator phasin